MASRAGAEGFSPGPRPALFPGRRLAFSLAAALAGYLL